MTTRSVAWACAVLAVGAACARRGAATTPAPAPFTTRVVALPGGPAPVRMDYLAFDAATGSLWVPAGNTGNVDVLHTATGALDVVAGFVTVVREVRGAQRTIGPSSASVGEGVVYVGDRADATVCALDATTRERRACVPVESSPDGLAWVAATRTLWVTAPSLPGLYIFPADAAGALGTPRRVPLDAMPEGYAVDAVRGIFYTNLEDGDATLALDVHTFAVLSRWSPHCGTAGPRGLAFDAAHRRLFVACTDAVVAFDASNGAVLGRADTGAGVDSIAFDAASQRVYAASGATAMLRVLHVAPGGALAVEASIATGHGARAVVLDDRGRAYVADSEGARLLVVEPR